MPSWPEQDKEKIGSAQLLYEVTILNRLNSILCPQLLPSIPFSPVPAKKNKQKKHGRSASPWRNVQPNNE